MSLARIKQFMDDYSRETRARTLDTIRHARETLRVEVRGMSEYIYMDGRIYRYGFVGPDVEHMKRIVSLMMSPDEFRHTFQLQVDDVAQLKPHLLTNNTLAGRRDILPAPVVMNNTTLKWLKGIYTHVTRLNLKWGTHFKTWDHVQLEDAQDILEELTRNDMGIVERKLQRLTTAILKSRPSSEDWDGDTIQTMVDAFAEVHGVNEIAFATMAANKPDNVDALYMAFLRYSAHTLEHDTFSRLPHGKHHVPQQAFIDQYTRNARLPPWKPRLPISTTPTLSSFKKLVIQITETLRQSHTSAE